MRTNFRPFAITKRFATIGIDALLNRLNLKDTAGKPAPIVWDGLDRYVLINYDEENYYRGIIVTSYQDGLSALNLEDFSVEEVNPGVGRKKFSVNFFAIHRENHCGLFQEQTDCLSLKGFGDFLKKQYIELKLHLRKMDSACLVLGSPTYQNDLNSINKRHKGSIKVCPYLTVGQFEDLVKKMNDFEYFQYEASVVGNSGEAWRTIASKATRRVDTIFFHARQPKGKQKIKDAVISTAVNVGNEIVELVKTMNPKKAKVRGRDVNGLWKVVRLLNNYEILETMNAEEFRGRWASGKLIDFASSRAMGTIMATIGRNSERFDAVIDDSDEGVEEDSETGYAIDEETTEVGS